MWDYWVYRNKPPESRAKARDSHRRHQCSDLKSVEIASLGSITVFEVFSIDGVTYSYTLKHLFALLLPWATKGLLQVDPYLVQRLQLGCRQYPHSVQRWLCGYRQHLGRRLLLGSGKNIWCPPWGEVKLFVSHKTTLLF